MGFPSIAIFVERHMSLAVFKVWLPRRLLERNQPNAHGVLVVLGQPSAPLFPRLCEERVFLRGKSFSARKEFSGAVVSFVVLAIHPIPHSVR